MSFDSITCNNCGKITKKAIREIKKNKTGRMYCSRSCSAKINNRLHPKRKMEGLCKCGKPTNKFRTYCNECYINFSIGDKTYGELMEGTKYQKNSRIRQHARKKYLKYGQSKSCLICGYSKHIDVCHIKDISSFPAEAFVKEINDLSNLIGLCKNHHWEFDRNKLSFDDEIKLQNYLKVALPGL